MGLMAFQYPGCFSKVIQCMVRCALYANGKRCSLPREYHSGKYAFKIPVSPPSYDLRSYVFDFMSSKMLEEGTTTSTPALNLSGGKTSGAADKFGLWNKWSTFSSTHVSARGLELIPASEGVAFNQFSFASNCASDLPPLG